MLKATTIAKQMKARKKGRPKIVADVMRDHPSGSNVIHHLLDPDTGFYVEEYFSEMLCLERIRSERSGRPFMLMMIDITNDVQGERKKHLVKKIADALFSITREIDLKGWHEHDHRIGVIFTEMNGMNKEIIKDKSCGKLCDHLNSKESSSIEVTFHVFPEEQVEEKPRSSLNMKLYPDVLKKDPSMKRSHLVKRGIDIMGSITALIIFSPLFLAIPLVIKLSSRGPVLFRQERLGLHGKRFTFLKFRSMHVNCKHDIHKEFVRKLIAKELEKAQEGQDSKTLCPYKIQDDPRITLIGKILRKSSLDELPQFINVLKGEMSLVGPRPPIAYEVENYDTWHHRRMLKVKPGITGMWQVHGRSSTTFDEMVRLDLKYCREWSLWLDIKLLLKTPRAVLIGKGAY